MRTFQSESIGRREHRGAIREMFIVFLLTHEHPHQRRRGVGRNRSPRQEVDNEELQYVVIEPVHLATERKYLSWNVCTMTFTITDKPTNMSSREIGTVKIRDQIGSGPRASEVRGGGYIQ
jgi:hypothetical protein